MRNRPSLIWRPPTRTASSKIIRLSMATNGVASWLPPYSWRQTAFGSMAASVMPSSRPSPWRPANRRYRIFPPGSNGPLSHRRLNDVYSPPTLPSARFEGRRNQPPASQTRGRAAATENKLLTQRWFVGERCSRQTAARVVNGLNLHPIGTSSTIQRLPTCR